MTPPGLALVAHTGHWAVQLIYVLPLVVLLGLIAVERVRGRRRAAEAKSSPAADGPAEEGGDTDAA